MIDKKNPSPHSSIESNPSELINSIPQNHHTTLPMAVNEFLLPSQCEDVLALTKNLQSTDAEIIRSENSSLDYSKRKSEITFLPPGDESVWLFLKLQELVESCNKQYQFDIQGFFEGVQVATYSEGGHFDWHMDSGPETRSLRKLAMTIQLSNDDDYKGGDLEFMGHEKRAPRERGTAIIFPTFLIHRVTPVTSGSRTSIVTWVHGNPFK